MVKRLRKDIRRITRIGVAGGVGLTALGAIGTPTNFTQGVSNIGGALPAVGTVMGSALLVRTLKSSFHVKKKRKRRR